jgi:hypothetical protein
MSTPPGEAGEDPNRSLPGNSRDEDAMRKERQSHREITIKPSMTLKEKLSARTERQERKTVTGSGKPA